MLNLNDFEIFWITRGIVRVLGRQVFDKYAIQHARFFQLQKPENDNDKD